MNDSVVPGVLAPALLDAEDDQFRLVRLQTYNWGTFGGVFELPVPEEGFLVLGPSGSGKSTLLDAHAALLTPPKWVSFNVAALGTDKGAKDRNAVTYVRGAWSQQTGDSGGAVHQYLRSQTSWSAIAETYRTRSGRAVVLAQVFWIKGKSIAPGDVRKQFLVLERTFDVRELMFFAESDFDVRRLKRELPDAFIRDEFSAYQERFRRLLGIDNERALRLLHKTQSAKNLGDLNAFLRDYMLDEPQTFAVADRLVAEFVELNAAHQSVVQARRQIETLAPARAAYEELCQVKSEMSKLDEVRAGYEGYREQRRKSLLEACIGELNVRQEGLAAELQRLTGLADQEYQKLTALKDRRHGMGGGLLEQLTTDIAAAERERDARVEKRGIASKACADLGAVLPDNAPAFAQLAADARSRILNADNEREQLETRRDELIKEKHALEQRFDRLRQEIAAMERQPSNIPAPMLDIRAEMARELDIVEAKLPFTGELIDVRVDSKPWQGAIERVLRGFALSLLVEDRYYNQVSAYVNDRDMGRRLVYLRTLPTAGSGARTLSPKSLVRKLDIARGPYAEWLHDQLAAGFDYECTESVQEFRSAMARAVTIQGQVKHSTSRHEKNDSYRINDRSQWVLGFENSAKLALYRNDAGQAGADLARVQQKLEQVKADSSKRDLQLRACQTLANLTWPEIDIASALDKVRRLNMRREEEKEKNPELGKLDTQISAQVFEHGKAMDRRNDAAGLLQSIGRDIAKMEAALDKLCPELLDVALTPTQREGLDKRFADLGEAVTLDSLDALGAKILSRMNGEERTIRDGIHKLERSIEERFADFVRNWPAEAGGLDPKMPSAQDFFAKLERLERDGLPKYEGKFFKLLHEQSDQNLALLLQQLEQERKDILARLDLVNESLLTAPFNPGTHLVIDVVDRQIEDVRLFKQAIRETFTRTYSNEKVEAKAQFEALSQLVRRLGSAEVSDQAWRKLVLDVRQHVEFMARELDETGLEVEVYASGAGKSGGQRQKLTATCLAAALRYQLGGQDRGFPTFSTVVMDEAFDKADSDFTATAMNIFRTFGFQMIVATPLKSVMTLEPFIGGACFITIKDRKQSSALLIEYDREAHRLKMEHGEEALTA